MLKVFLILFLITATFGSRILRRSKRAMILRSAIKWTDGVVPYEYGISLTRYERNNVTAAFRAWEQVTCIRFRRRRTSDRKWIRLESGNRCHSLVGQTNVEGAQLLTLGPRCLYSGVVAHELGHALGLLHEHNRPNRDEHIRIDGSKGFNSKERARLVNTYNSPYDLQSIMHYGIHEFPRNNHPELVDSTKSRLVEDIYYKDISFFDAKAINKFYRCYDNCRQTTCEGQAYLNASCVCEGPAEYADRRCRNLRPDADCNARADQGHCSLYKAEMRYFCRKSCNTCFKHGTHGVNERRIACADHDRYCEAWARRGECTKNPAYMKVTCPKSCRECVPTAADSTLQPLTTPRPCRDVQPKSNCLVWKRLGNCENRRFRTWMSNNCYATCSSCDGQSSIPCVDLEPVAECRRQKAAGYCYTDEYKLWMMQNCYKTCTQCTPVSTTTTTPTPTTTTRGPTTTPPRPAGCRDQNPSCPSWAQTGECNANPVWMHANCQYSCNTCPQATTAPAQCQDLSYYCKEWASLGRCSSNAAYMRANCKMSCNLCPCVNILTYCPRYSTGCHSRNHFTKCRKSCNSCGICRDRRSDCPRLSQMGYCRYSSVLPDCPYSCNVCA